MTQTTFTYPADTPGASAQLHGPQLHARQAAQQRAFGAGTLPPQVDQADSRDMISASPIARIAHGHRDYAPVALFMGKQSFAVSKFCPVVNHGVAITGRQMVLPSGATEVVMKTCFKFSHCYQDLAGAKLSRNIVPKPGCLLGNADL